MRFASSASIPREGLIHSLLTAEIDGDRLTEEEVIANCIVTMVGGQETTTNLIGNGLLTLLRNPEEMERLRSDPSLIPSAVEELLRYESPSQHTARMCPVGRGAGRQDDPQAAGGDRGDGGGEPRSGTISRSRPIRHYAQGQSAPGVWLGGAFLFWRAAGANGRSDCVRDDFAAAFRILRLRRNRWSGARIWDCAD